MIYFLASCVILHALQNLSAFKNTVRIALSPNILFAGDIAGTRSLAKCNKLIHGFKQIISTSASTFRHILASFRYSARQCSPYCQYVISLSRSISAQKLNVQHER